MKAFTRNFLRIASISIIVGIILIVISVSMDNTLYKNITIGGFSLMGNNSDWSGNDINDLKEIEDSNYVDNNNSNNTSNSDESVDDSLNVSELSLPRNTDKVQNIALDIVAASVIITEGEEFGIKVNDIGLKRIESKYSDGVWSVKDSALNTEKNTGINIFGINIDTNSLQNNIARVKITIPKEFKGKKIELTVGAGSITVDKLIAEEITISVGAGSCKIDELIANEKSSYSVGAGEIIINNLVANNAKFDCSMGSINVEGIIKGRNTAICSMGTIDLDLEGNEIDYNYDIKCSLGSVSLNGSSISSLYKNYIQDNEAANEFTVNCNVGTINLNISE